MPNPYSIDLRWRIVWAYLSQSFTTFQISELFSVSERTVRRYISLFHQTGDIEPTTRKYGPEKLMGEFEQLTLLQIIFNHPGIYLAEIQNELCKFFGVTVSIPTICKTLKSMGCTRQAMHHVALQRSDASRAKFMSEISIYDPTMLIWLDESGCDRRNTIRKYGYSIRGIPLCDQRLLIRGIRYTTIPIISTQGIHDAYIAEGNINGDRFSNFIEKCLLPLLQPFNGINPHSVVIMDNASIHHVDDVAQLIEVQGGARLVFLPPYSPDLNPAEGIFSQVKSLMKENDSLFQVCSAPRAMLAMIFGMITAEDCNGHISHCGYTM